MPKETESALDQKGIDRQFDEIVVAGTGNTTSYRPSKSGSPGVCHRPVPDQVIGGDDVPCTGGCDPGCQERGDGHEVATPVCGDGVGADTPVCKPRGCSGKQHGCGEEDASKSRFVGEGVEQVIGGIGGDGGDACDDGHGKKASPAAGNCARDRRWPDGAVAYPRAREDGPRSGCNGNQGECGGPREGQASDGGPSVQGNGEQDGHGSSGDAGGQEAARE